MQYWPLHFQHSSSPPSPFSCSSCRAPALTSAVARCSTLERRNSSVARSALKVSCAQISVGLRGILATCLMDFMVGGQLPAGGTRLGQLMLFELLTTSAATACTIVLVFAHRSAVTRAFCGVSCRKQGTPLHPLSTHSPAAIAVSSATSSRARLTNGARQDDAHHRSNGAVGAQ